MRRTGLTLPRLAALAAGFLLLGGTVAAQAAPKIQVHFIAGHGETWTDPDPSDANNVSTLGPFAANAPIPLINAAYSHRNGPADNNLQWSWILNADPTRTVDDIKQDDPGCTPWNAVDKVAAYAAYPASCPWPAVTKINSGTTNTLITSGDQGAFQLDTPTSGVATIDPSSWATCTSDPGDNGAFALPLEGCIRPGKHHYLISVQADGYEVAGGFFDFDPNGDYNGATAGQGVVDVYVPLSANPIPLATYRTDVFFDMSGTNAEYDRDPETPPADGSGSIVPGVTTTTTDADGNLVAVRNGLLPAGFEAKITDIMGEAITQNAFGDPICTVYAVDPNKPAVDGVQPWLDADGDGVPDKIVHPGGICTSDNDGHVIIRDLEPNRYSITMSPPPAGLLAVDTSGFGGRHTYHRIPVADAEVKSNVAGALELSQTTTLEGSHDWDQWMLAGDTGLDAEFTTGSEKVSPVFSGWAVYDPSAQHNGLDNAADAGAKKKTVPAAALPDTSVGLPQGSIHGFAHNAYSYSADPVNGNLLGATDALQQDAGPQTHLWLALTDLTNGDQTIFAAPFYNADGEFTIAGIPEGDYLLSYWDFDQLTIMESENVTVTANHRTEVHTLRMPQWWTKIEGSVFNDENGNGKQDPGEPGIPGQLVTLRSRENNLFEQGSNAAVTDLSGHYELIGAYPLGQWTVLEQYTDGYKTTGITYQGSNDNSEHTIHGGGVDINVFNFIGQGHRIDWAKQPYAANENGGIVGSVSSGTTRNEQDPREAVLEDWQPGIPGLTVHLYGPEKDANNHVQYKADGSILLVGQAPTDVGTNNATDLGPSYVTEEWQRPTDCQPLDGVGNKVFYPFMAGWDGFPGSGIGSSNTPGRECVESFSDGPIVGWDGADPNAFDGTTVNGNFGLADLYNDPTAAAAALAAGAPDTDPRLETHPIESDTDYVVKVDIPDDVQGKPLWTPTREEDINVFSGDSVATPQVALPDCAGKTHVVDVMGVGTDNYAANLAMNPPFDAVRNPSFRDTGGSRYEGVARHDCDEKLVHLDNGRSTAPLFEFKTPVQLPGIHWGLLIDDLSQSVDPTQVLYGDNAPGAGLPINWYDWAHRFVRGTVADPDGFYEVMLPSTNRINAPTPSGVSPQIYDLVANDQATFDPATNKVRPNPDYNPGYRTISAAFQMYPGDSYGTDLALTPTSTNVFSPATQQVTVAACLVDSTTPQVFAVNRPFVIPGSGINTMAVTGIGFSGSPTVTLTPSAGGSNIVSGGGALTVSGAADNHFTLTFNNVGAGTYNMYVSAGTGAAKKTSTNGLTVHVFGSTYAPNVVAVDAGDPAITGTATSAASVGGTLVSSTSWFTPDLVGAQVVIPSTTAGNGQIREITGTTGNTLTVTPAWGTVPGNNAAYTVVRSSMPVFSGRRSNSFFGQSNASFTVAGGGVPAGLATAGDVVMFLDGGTDAGQIRRITGNSTTSIQVAPNLPGTPSANAQFVILKPTGNATAAVTSPFTTMAVSNSFPTNELATSRLRLSGVNADIGNVSAPNRNDNERTIGGNTTSTFTGLSPALVNTLPGGLPSSTVRYVVYRSASTTTGSANLPATLTKASAGWTPGAFVGWQVSITGGTGAGQTRLITMNTADTLTISGNWTTTPNSTSVFSISAFDKVQDGVDYAEAQFPSSNSNKLVVVYPGAADANNPTGSYEENLIISKRLKLQGVGPGGTYPRTYGITSLQGQSVPGADLNGWGFTLKTIAPDFAPESYADAWYTRVLALQTSPGWDGNQTIADGETIYVVAQDGEFGLANSAPSYRAQIDGFTIEGGDNFDFPGTINPEGGGPLPPAGNEAGQPVAQGGGVYLNAYARHTEITNNVIKSNSGSFGGGIRVGTPALGTTGNDSSHNDDVLIANNQILRNGGANLAGAIGLFNGSNNYHVTQNMICGNYSAEYGAGISVYGMSPGGLIDFNRIRFNQSYDEGAGVIIAGQLPAPKTIPNQPPTQGSNTPQGVSPGSGSQTINANVIQENIAGDDGGGLRFLMSGTGTMTVTNNMIVNNVSAHEGGGIAIDDATAVRVINNTIAKNITTATAMTSNGAPAPAGLSTGKLSTGILTNTQSSTYGGCGVVGGIRTCYSQPLLQNNIFWDNRAGTYAAGDVTGIGPHLGSTSTNVCNWDVGNPDGAAKLANKRMLITNSIFQNSSDYSQTGEPTSTPWRDWSCAATTHGGTGDNKNSNPSFVDPYDASVRLSPFRANPIFIGGVIVATNLPASLHDYHLQSGSPAINAGANTSSTGVTSDIDAQPRPSANGQNDIGADEASSATATVVIPTSLVRSVTAQVTVRPAAATAANRFVPGSRATRTVSKTCADCTAVMTVKKGHKVRTVRVHSTNGTFKVALKHLKAGTYHVQVTVTSRSLGTIYRSAWRTVHVKRTSTHGKGKR